MVFNKNLALLRNKVTGFCYFLTAKEAMKYINYDYRDARLHSYTQSPEGRVDGIDYIPTELKVKAAKDWAGKNLYDDGKPIEVMKVSSDWTFTTPYKGTITTYKSLLEHSEGLASPKPVEFEKGSFSVQLTDEKIPLDRLTPQNPILFFQDVVFFEDELDDFGKVEVRIRFRCMEDCAFGLIRCYLRNDGVLVRSLDTRLFIDFNKDYVLREFTVKEATYDELQKKGFKLGSEFNTHEGQVDIVQPYLDTKLTVREKLSVKESN